MTIKIGSGATPLGGKSVYIESGTALIRSQNIYNDGFRREGLTYVTSEHADRLSSVEVMAGDVLLNITGESVARACLAPNDILPARVNQHVAIIRTKPDELDAKYLRFFLISPQMQAHMMSLAGGGATRNALTKTMIEQFEIPWRPLPEQRRIAHILGSLDDKIELNRRMNATLEGIARALFQSWFVDFDPVRAKAAGHQPAGMDAATAALFPDAFEDSPLGPIPRGWEVGTISDIGADKRIGVDPGRIPAGTPYIGLEHMPRRSIALQDWGLADAVVSGKSAFERGDILFGKLRPYFHKVGVAPTDGVCSTDIVVAAPKSNGWFGLLLGHLSSEEFIAYTDATSGGTRMPRTSWKDMARYAIAIPDAAVAARFDAIARTLVDRIIANAAESRLMAEVRDTLLPHLLSGKVPAVDTRAGIPALVAN